MRDGRGDVDVRDEALATVLDGAVERIQAVPRDRLGEVLRRGSQRRVARFSAIGAAMTLSIGAVAWAGLSLPSRDASIPANVADWQTFASLEDNGWTIRVPPPWHVTELPACENAPERIGVMVTNVEFAFRDPQGGAPDCAERLVMAGFPRTGVALGFMPIDGDSIPGALSEEPDSVLPLEPDLLVATGGIRGGPAESYQTIWRGGGWIGTVRRFIGSNASPTDIEALDRMLGLFAVAGAPRWEDREIVGPGGVRVTFRVPPDWRSDTFPAVQAEDVFQPVARLATPEVRDGHCPGAPEPMGFDNLGDGGTVIVVSDGINAFVGRDVGGRPSTFRASEATEDLTVHCGDEIRILSFVFREAGRPILIQVAKARHALNEAPEALRYILGRIRIAEG